MASEVTIRAEVDDVVLDQVERIAQSRGMTPSALVGEALRDMVAHDAWLREQVEEGRRAIHEGRFISHEELEEELRRRYG